MVTGVTFQVWEASREVRRGFLGNLDNLVYFSGPLSFQEDPASPYPVSFIPRHPNQRPLDRTTILDLPSLPATVYLSPLLPGFTGALPVLHIGQESTA